MNLESYGKFRKFLIGVALAGMILFLGFGMGVSTTAHAQHVAASPNQIFLPLVLRNFPPPTAQTLTVNKGGAGSGTVTSSPVGINCGLSCSASFNYNTSVTLTAIASTGSNFAGWSSSGCSGSGVCVVKMDAARSVTATFTVNYYNLIIGMTGSGSGTVTSNPAGIDCGSICFYAFPYNTVVTLTATPIAPSSFAGWSEGACSGTGTCQVTMNSDKQALATFNLACIGIGNCDFEKGRDGQWTEYSSNDLEIITDCSNPLFCNDIAPHSGVYLAWLGGEINETSYIQQQISIVPDAPYLVYWQWIDSFDFCGYDYDYVEVLINTSRVDKVDLCTGTSTMEWVQHNIDLTNFAGQSVTLQIRVKTDENGYSSIYIDDLSLQSSP